MTPLALLLSGLRISLVSGSALALAHLLLVRRPRVVPATVVTGLVCSCLLLVAPCLEWPALWEAALPTESFQAPGTGPVSQDAAQTAHGRPFELSLAAIGRLLQRLDTHPTGPSWEPWPLLLLGLVAVMLVAVGRVLLGIIWTWRIKRSSQVIAPARLTALAAELSAAAGGRARVIFRTSDQIDAPCVLAIDGGTIYLPRYWHELTTDELRATVAHEMGHLHHRDAVWRLVAQGAAALQVLHPWSHGMLRQLVLAQELSADRWASNRIGTHPYVRGISRLALRLDAGAPTCPADRIGMSHSTSFLIRRITMLRKGMHASEVPNGTTRDRTVVTRRMAVATVLATAVISASWTLSADDTPRVAARTGVERDARPTVDPSVPWEQLPGRSGYWSLNVAAIRKHALVGPWVAQVDALFLTPAWSNVARPAARDQRTALGLSLDNVVNLAGTATVTNKTTAVDGEKPRIETGIQSGEGILTLQAAVDWQAVGRALNKDRLETLIAGLVGKDLSAEAAQQLVEKDTVGTFFQEQADPHRLIVRQRSDEVRPPTPQALIALWGAHRGELATLIAPVPRLEGASQAAFDQLVASLHDASEFFLIGIDQGDQPERLRVRLGLTTRGDTTPQELATLAGHVLRAAVERTEDGEDQEFLQRLEQAETTLHAPTAPSQPGAVIFHIDLPVATLWQVFAG